MSTPQTAHEHVNIDVTECKNGQVVRIAVTGKLTTDDYDRFLPEIERAIALPGELRILLTLHDFHGWTAGALWEDLKFDIKHFNDINRLAIVGESKWQEGMSTFCKPFTTAKINYFEKDQLAAAEAWIFEDMN